MTPEQNRCLEFIGRYTRIHGWAPAYPEIAAALDLASKSSVNRLVEALVEQGRLKRTADRTRNLVVIGDGELAAVPTAQLLAELERRNLHPTGVPQ